MKTAALLSISLLAGTTVALGAPRESFNIVTLNGGPLNGTALYGGAGNSTVNVNALGTDAGGAYTARSVRVNGTVVYAGATYGAESHILVLAPGGAGVVFQPNGRYFGHPTGNFAFDQSLSLTPAATAGAWTVSIFEDYDDAGVDATYSALTMTLNDAPAVAPTPPTVNIDLGDLSAGATANDPAISNTAAAQVKWVKAILPACPATGNGYVDLWTSPGATLAMTTPIMAVYNGTSGLLVDFDDGSGPGATNAQLSFGSTVSRGPSQADGLADGAERDGVNGPLTGGVYYIAIARETLGTNLTLPDLGYGVSSNYTGTERNTVLHVRTQENSVPTPPQLYNESVTPMPATAGATVTIAVTVANGANPTSTGVQVTADLGSLGASGVVMTPIGGGVYTCTGTIPAGVNDFTQFSVVLHAVDGQSRQADDVTLDVPVIGPVNWDEVANGAGDTGQTLATAQEPTGSGSLTAITGSTNATDDLVDMYKIHICDFASFVATTSRSADEPDTQIFLFDSNGMGVEMNDDMATAVTSYIDGTNVTANGEYYLAVSRYDIDPMDAAGALIWSNPPFTGVNAPNGPAAANPLDHFDATAATAASSGAYRISLAGVCFPAPAQCSPADVGVQGGGPGHDNLLNNNDFIAFIDLFFAQSHAADLGSQGGEQGSDNLWDNNDFIVFIDYFFNDTPNCQG